MYCRCKGAFVTACSSDWYIQTLYHQCYNPKPSAPSPPHFPSTPIHSSLPTTADADAEAPACRRLLACSLTHETPSLNPIVVYPGDDHNVERARHITLIVIYPDPFLYHSRFHPSSNRLPLSFSSIKTFGLPLSPAGDLASVAVSEKARRAACRLG
jgi:hypothetical protein